MTLNKLSAALQIFLQQQGHAGRLLGNVEAMAEGHAGLAYSFAVSMPDETREDYILKLAPAGVTRSGSTDIYRQYPLLKRLRSHHLPVPHIIWASDEDKWLGAPFIVMERLRGRSLIVWEAKPSENLPDYWLGAARLLALFHDKSASIDLSDWEAPTTLEEELTRWRRLIRHSSVEADRVHAEHLAGRLADTLPANPAVGLVHGDFQPGNILYVDGQPLALIDWDLAAVGPLPIDLGWLLMMADGEAWADDWKPKGAPPRAGIIAAYRDCGGDIPEALSWYQAFACFRMGVIIGMNVKLHREGRRPDPIWDRFASSASTLLARGTGILGELVS